MKYWKKISVTIAMVGCIFTSTNLGVSSAALLPNGNAFWPCEGFVNSVITNNRFYEDPSIAALGFEWANQTARDNWDSTANASVGYTRVSTYESADTRVFAGDYTWATYSGLMQAYNSEGTEVTDAQLMSSGHTWLKAHILINDGEMNRDGYSGTDKAKTVTHEWGHTMNMFHQPNAPEDIMLASVMKQGKVPYYAPQTTDFNNVSWKY